MSEVLKNTARVATLVAVVLADSRIHASGEPAGSARKAACARAFSEIAGDAARHRGNASPIFAAVYTNLLKEYAGREREVVEELIRRYEAKGMNPVEISTKVGQRVRQCVH